MQKQDDRRTNWAQVREQIDRGETGDKVAAEDPAAASLGTNAEAGGAPTAPADLERSSKHEQAVPDNGRGSGDRRIAAIAVGAVIVAVVVVALALA
jgi:hypothetical protein